MAIPVSAGFLSVLLLSACDMGPKRPPMESKPVILDFDRQKLTQPYAKAFGDLDGDGMPDIIIGELGGPIFCYRFPGWERRTLNGNNGGDDIAVADFNGDGRLDLASNGRQVAWYENTGDTAGSFKEHVLLPGHRTHDLAAGDVDGNGRIDIVTRDGKSGLTLLLLQESGGRWSEVPLVHALAGVGTALADMDGDGRTDILGGGYWLAQGADPKSPEGWRRVMVAAWPASSAVEAYDVDRDGRMDLILAAASREYRLSWFRNPGPRSSPEDTSYWIENVIARGMSHVQRVRLADVDRNGTVDILFAEQHQSRRRRVGVMLNKGGTGASWQMKLFDDKGAHNFAVADVGKDGMLEVLAVNWAGDTRIRLLTGLLRDPDRADFARNSHPGLRRAAPTRLPQTTAVAGSTLSDD